MRTSQAGFTLIEVIVAMAIVIASMGVLLQLFSGGLHQMHRAGHTQHLILVKRMLLEDIQSVNPALVASQSGVLEGVTFQWEAAPSGRSIDVFAQKLQLYRINVTLTELDGSQDALEFLQLGWQYSQPAF